MRTRRPKRSRRIAVQQFASDLIEPSLQFTPERLRLAVVVEPLRAPGGKRLLEGRRELVRPVRRLQPSQALPDGSWASASSTSTVASTDAGWRWRKESTLSVGLGTTPFYSISRSARMSISVPR